ncbi:MAG: RNA methyltransferase [Treponema sp.]|nr:RNA methyltransferase [Treponema sp.]
MRNKRSEELAVCGFNAVQALGTYHPEQIYRLFLREDKMKDFGAVCKKLAAMKRFYKISDDEELEKLCKSNRHQGVVAMIREPKPIIPTDELFAEWSAKGKIGVLLSSVGNDHNLGAIIRSAAFFNADYIVLSAEDKEAKLTTSTYRVAEGGMEHVTIVGSKNPEAFVKRASQDLILIGADHNAKQILKNLPEIIKNEQKTKRGILLVVGNEENGIPSNIREQCLLVSIPGSKKMESLNVAQAATLFLHEIWQPQAPGKN